MARRPFIALAALTLATTASVSAGTSSTSSFLPRQSAAALPARDATATDYLAQVPPSGGLTALALDSKLRTDAAAITTLPRGGGDAPTTSQLGGVVVFALIEIAVRKALQAKGIRFPSQLAGCVLLFTSLIIIQIVSPGSGDVLCDALSPAAGLLAKWMGVFFVPGLAMLPLAPSVGSALEIVKTLGVVIVGFFYSLFTVTFAVYGVRKALGNLSEDDSSSRDDSPEAAGPVAKPYSAETLDFLVKGTVVTAALSIAATRTDQPFSTPLQTIFLVFATLATYVWGSCLPASVTKLCNPLITCALGVLLFVRLTGIATESTFIDVLKSYTAKSLRPMEAGAGDVLLYLLSPSVISFAIGMYKGKNLIAANLPAILTAVLTGSVGSMFGTAAFARIINLGGSKGAVLRRSTLPRSVQTALGMIIAEMLGGDVAIAATMIILTGIFGGMVGVKTLDAWGVKDSVSRGLGIGSAGLSLGVVSIKGEPEAFAFAGVCLVLTAVAATCLATIPAAADLMTKIAGGAPKVVSAAARAV